MGEPHKATPWAQRVAPRHKPPRVQPNAVKTEWVKVSMQGGAFYWGSQVKLGRMLPFLLFKGLEYCWSCANMCLLPQISLYAPHWEFNFWQILPPINSTRRDTQTQLTTSHLQTSPSSSFLVPGEGSTIYTQTTNSGDMSNFPLCITTFPALYPIFNNTLCIHWASLLASYATDAVHHSLLFICTIHACR